MDKENNHKEGTDNIIPQLLQKEILTFEEACTYLGRSASFMYKMTSRRLIPHYVPNGKLIYFKRLELDEWVLHHKRRSLDEIQQESRDFKLHPANRTKGQ